MDGPGTYSQPPYAGGSKDESGTAAKDTISIGSGDRVSGADRMGMEVHTSIDSRYILEDFFAKLRLNYGSAH